MKNINSRHVLAGVVAIIVVVTAGIVLTSKKSDTGTEHDDSHGSKSKVTGIHANHREFNACGILTDTIAKEVLGSAATKGDNTDDTVSQDIRLSNCSYTLNTGDVKSIKVATVLVRWPISDEGLKSNEVVFGDQTPAGVDKLQGLGEASYWDSSTGTLNILQHHAWIIITYGSASMKDRSVADARTLAEKILVNAK